MANRELKTKIKLRYDLLANWTAKNPELLAGEIAIVAIPSDVTEMQVNGSQPPQILFKVGPGNFDDLPYASAKAADVHGWAKAASKPTYTAAEVGAYSKTELDPILAGIDHNTTYRFDLSKTNEIAIYSKEIGGEESLLGTFKVDFEAINAEIAKKLDSETFNNFKSGYDTTIAGINESLAKKLEASHIEGKADKSYVDDELAKKVNLEAYNTKIGEIEGKIRDVEGDISDINGDLDTIDGEITRIDGVITGINEEVAKKADKTYVDTELGKKVDASDLNSRGYATNSQLESGLNTKVDKTVYEAKMESLDGSISSLNSDKVNNSDFEAYKTEADGKFLTSDEVDAHINQVITDAVDGDALTSLTELVSYINTHGGEAAEMATAIENIEKQLDGIDAGTGTVKKYVDDVVAALKIGDYAKASDLLAAVGRIEVLEGDVKTLKETTIPGLESRIEDYETNKGTFALKSELFSGSYNDLKDKPNLNVYETIENADKVRADVKSIKDDYLKGSDKTELSNAISTEKGRIDTLVTETIPGINSTIDTLATKAEVSEAITNSHKHDNKAILDATTASFTTELKTKYDGYESSINDFVNNTRGYATTSQVESVSNRVKAIEDDTTILRSTDVFVWDCGGAE